jgi:hypothetical protein
MTRRRPAVLPRRDLAIGSADPDGEAVHQQVVLAGHRFGNVDYLRCTGAARLDS